MTERRTATEVAMEHRSRMDHRRFKHEVYRDCRPDLEKTEYHWKITDRITGMFEDGECVGLTAYTKQKPESLARLIYRIVPWPTLNRWGFPETEHRLEVTDEMLSMLRVDRLIKRGVLRQLLDSKILAVGKHPKYTLLEDQPNTKWRPL